MDATHHAQHSGMGHNQPPAEATAFTRADELLAAAERAVTDFREITDQAAADRLSGFLKQLQAAQKELDGHRRIRVDPLNAKVRAINGEYKPYTDRIKRAVDAVKCLLSAFLRKQDEELQRQREEKHRRLEEARARAGREQRQAQELQRKAQAGELAGAGASPLEAEARADEAQAQVEAAEREAKRAEQARPQAGGQFVGPSGRARSHSLRTYYDIRITDRAQAVAAFADHHLVREAVERAARDWAQTTKGAEQRPGVEIIIEQRAA